jgi:hypothetical protein
MSRAGLPGEGIDRPRHFFTSGDVFPPKWRRYPSPLAGRRGFKAIHRRIAAAREAFACKTELVSALGGEADLTPQRRRLIDVAVRSPLFLGSSILPAYHVKRPRKEPAAVAALDDAAIAGGESAPNIACRWACVPL